MRAKPARDKVRNMRKGEDKLNRGGNPGPLAKDGRLYLNICAGIPAFLITPLLMGPVCLLRQVC